MRIGEVEAQAGERVCVDVEVRNFQQILGMQYTIKWDTTVLRFQETASYNLPALTAQNFGRPPSFPARLTVAWYNPNLVPVDKDNGSTLYQICFEAVGASGAESSIEIVDQPTIIELVQAGEEDQTVPLNTLPGKVTIR